MNVHDACENAYKNGYNKASEEADTIMVDGCDIVHNAKVHGLKGSIRRSKFPMSTNNSALNTDLTDGVKKLAQAPKGSGHDQFLTGIIVQFDLTFSNKAWVEMERYHFIDFVSSQSTMHRISKFNLRDCCNEYVDDEIIAVLEKLKADYLAEEDAEKAKEKYLKLLYNVPSGFRLTAGMTTNYRQLKTIYSQRKNHRLPEWRTFCKWIETLPENELITEGVQGND